MSGSIRARPGTRSRPPTSTATARPTSCGRTTDGQAGDLADGWSERLTAGSNVGFNPGAAWHVIDAGDFDGDGKADILWQNNNGQAAVWLMDGFTVKSGSDVGFNPGAAWHVQAAGDFNGDGKADILWQNADGTPAIWLMNGTSLIAARMSASIRARPGRSTAPATSTATARPTSNGRTPTARRRCG